MRSFNSNNVVRTGNAKMDRAKFFDKLKALMSVMTTTEKGFGYMPPSVWCRNGSRKRHGPGTAKSYLPGVRKGAFLLSAKEWAQKYPGRKDCPRTA